jgi:sugar phosphate isomerase/epimerase
MQWITAPNPARSYYSVPSGYYAEFKSPVSDPGPQIENVIGVRDIGQSVAEGSRFGTFLQTTQAAIRGGAGKIELSTSMGGGGESVGAEAYGKDARNALKEISKANSVEFVSVHTPAQIGNLSGYNPQERGFSDEHRKYAIEEIKRAIHFAADVGGKAVVVHTGEYQRDMSDQPWAKNADGSYKFLNYDEEPGRSVLYMVDDRTGRLITEVRKSIVIHEPEFKSLPDPSQGGRQRWVDINGKFINETNTDDLMKRVPVWNTDYTRFDTRRMAWQDFVDRANDWNKYNPKHTGDPWTPEEMFFRSQMETRILQSRGYSLFQGRQYEEYKTSYDRLKEVYDNLKKIEDKVPVEEQWRLMEQDPIVKAAGGNLAHQYGGMKNKLPSEIIGDNIKQLELNLRHIHEASAAADAQATESIETLQHVVPVSTYAKMQSNRSYAEAGIYAMEQTHEKKINDVYIAPENIFPEMGYGSHPQELIQMVQDGRKEMVRLLISPKIPDPQQIRDRKTGELIMVDNPYFRRGMSSEEAKKEAAQHIKATIDTQHLGMWWKHFQPKQGESLEDRKARFDKWYMDQISDLEKSNIVGHIHVVDAMGSGHSHLPVGQGVWPVREALEYLKKKGFKGSMISEAYGEDSMHGPGRIFTEALRGLGSPIRGYAMGAPSRWPDIQHSYFGVTQNPYFIFGAYAPSNDWQLWSQVPFE